MAPHSSVLAWRIPGTGEPGGLLSMASHRVRHDWSDLAVAAASYGNSLIAQRVKNLPAIQETWVLCLGQEDPLEKEMTTHSSILACIPWTEEPGGIQSMGLQTVGHNWATSTSIPLDGSIIVFKLILDFRIFWDFPGGPAVKTSPPIAGDRGSIPGQRAKILHASWLKFQNIKPKQYCYTFKKDFKKMVHKKIFKKY